MNIYWTFFLDFDPNSMEKILHPELSTTFIFPETSFITVTAYQNQQVIRWFCPTNLNIQENALPHPKRCSTTPPKNGLENSQKARFGMNKYKNCFIDKIEMHFSVFVRSNMGILQMLSPLFGRVVEQRWGWLCFPGAVTLTPLVRRCLEG